MLAKNRRVGCGDEREGARGVVRMKDATREQDRREGKESECVTNPYSLQATASEEQ